MARSSHDATLIANLNHALDNARSEHDALTKERDRAERSAEFWRTSWEALAGDIGELARRGEAVTPAELLALLDAQVDKPPDPGIGRARGA
jgi:hypothetical protein